MSPTLAPVVTVRDTAKQLFCEELGTLYRALSAEASTAYGLSPVLIIHDELGQVKGPRSELYEALETATGAQESPLSIVISTQSPTDADLLSLLIEDGLSGADPRVVVSLYTAPMDADPFTEETIRLANPAFGDFQNAKETLAMAEDARRMPSREAEYRNLILNQRVDMSAPFISRAAWQDCGSPVLDSFEGLPVFGGLDLSEVNDLTALVLVAPVEKVWHVHPTFWLPGVVRTAVYSDAGEITGYRDEPSLPFRSRKDRVPYDVWHKGGFLSTTPGPTVDYEFVADHLAALVDRVDVRKIAFDRYNWRHLKPWLAKAGFSESQLDGDAAIFEEMGQGFQSMSPALRDLESAILNQRIAHGGHPVLTMCAANATVQADPAGNRKLSKIKSHGRIDGMVALAMAMSVAGTAQEPAPASPWDDPEYRFEVT